MPGSPPFALFVDTRDAVDTLHRVALAESARDHGAPVLGPRYYPDYYAAFALDRGGYNIAAVCHTSESHA